MHFIRYVALRKTNFNVSLCCTSTQGNTQEELCLQGNEAGALAEKDRNLSRVSMGKERGGDAAFHPLDPWSVAFLPRKVPREGCQIVPQTFFAAAPETFSLPPSALWLKNRFLGSELCWWKSRGAGCLPSGPMTAEGLHVQGQQPVPTQRSRATTYQRSGLGPAGSATWPPGRAPRCPHHPEEAEEERRKTAARVTPGTELNKIAKVAHLSFQWSQ